MCDTVISSNLTRGTTAAAARCGSLASSKVEPCVTQQAVSTQLCALCNAFEFPRRGAQQRSQPDNGGRDTASSIKSVSSS